jgi:hypothetical protein
MGKVYSTPSHIKRPAFDIKNWRANEEAQIKQVKDWVKQNSTDKYAGEELNIPHADGQACYIVFSLKPVKLVHLEIGDCWDAPLAHRMTAKDIVTQIEGQKRIKALFGKR